jgi:hypothetical protein
MAAKLKEEGGSDPTRAPHLLFLFLLCPPWAKPSSPLRSTQRRPRTKPHTSTPSTSVSPRTSPPRAIRSLPPPLPRPAPAHARAQPWPIIAAFLAAQPRTALGLDAGTGNGKYLPLAPQLLGLDRSGALLGIARRGGAHEVVRGDVLDAPWRAGVFVRPRRWLCRARS